MPDKPLPARSLAEVYLYLMATPCTLCARGPLQGEDPQPQRTGTTGLVLHMQVTCAACRATSTLGFELPADAGMAGADPLPEINPTLEPSRLIDLAQWITLFRSIADAAAREGDRQEARRLGIEAALCLEEGLKFYDEDDNDLPPREAFFTDATRARLREHPEHFSRRRLRELRAKLPTISRMASRTRALAGAAPAKRPWWKFWKG